MLALQTQRDTAPGVGSRRGILNEPRRITATDSRAAQVELAKLATTLEARYAVRRPTEQSTRVQLEPISEADFRRRAADLAAPILWLDDGKCYYRAGMGAMYVIHAQRAKGSKAAPIGPGDALAAGMAFVPHPTQLGRDPWLFHSATVMRVQGRTEPMVVDYLLFDEPVPVSRWAQRVGKTPDQVSIVHPAVAGLQMYLDADKQAQVRYTDVGSRHRSGTMRGHSQYLKQTWQTAASAKFAVRNELIERAGGR